MQQMPWYISLSFVGALFLAFLKKYFCIITNFMAHQSNIDQQRSWQPTYRLCASRSPKLLTECLHHSCGLGAQLISIQYLQPFIPATGTLRKFSFTNFSFIQLERLQQGSAKTTLSNGIGYYFGKNFIILLAAFSLYYTPEVEPSP